MYIYLKFIKIKINKYKKLNLKLNNIEINSNNYLNLSNEERNLLLNNNKEKNRELINIYDSNLKLNLGFNNEGKLKYIDNSGLFQNIIITGSIGSGKTASAMYPITKQLIEYSKEKIGMLILDVKGNYYEYVKELCEKNNREQDLIIIGINENIKYNPLDKPELNAGILASRLKYIMQLFSPNSTESFWQDKAEQLIKECIKAIRIYNENYVDFIELHKLVNDENYYYVKKFELENIKKITLESLLIENSNNKYKSYKYDIENINYSKETIYNINTFIEYMENEFLKLDDRIKGIIRAEISRITTHFISEYSIKNIFCPNKNEVNFQGFEEVIKKGKIVVLNMNISKYKELSKIIASYLKLDFQTEVLNQLSKEKESEMKEIQVNKTDNKNNQKKPNITAFICDEYQEYVTKNDGDFYAQSREAKCISIVSTQSYSSLKEKLKDENITDVIIQNLMNKICFRTDDIYTIEKIQKITGKEYKKSLIKSISENPNKTELNIFNNEIFSKESTISESINENLNYEYIYDTNYFIKELNTFEALVISNKNNKLDKIEKINMIKYFLL